MPPKGQVYFVHSHSLGVIGYGDLLQDLERNSRILQSWGVNLGSRGCYPGVRSTNPQMRFTETSVVLETLGVGFVWKSIGHLCVDEEIGAINKIQRIGN